MTAHLLQIAIGPVQEFIAAARRTRDLWFGSYLLSEISKAAALSVRAQGGTLIFPHHEAELKPRWEEVSVANIIVADLPDGKVPNDVAKEAKKKALARWRQIADPVRDEFRPYLRLNVWDEQIGDVVEFYAAWVPFALDTYAAQRKRLARLTAGRKSCREFHPAPQHEGLPKSSLDGLRDTVFVEGKRQHWPRRLRLRAGEQLDVVGLVKRTALDSEEKEIGHRPYPSVSRVAADPWLRGVASAEGGEANLAPLREVCRSLRNAVLLHQINTGRLHDDYARFPYEGTALYRTRHHEMVEETSDPEEREERKKQLRPLGDALGRVEQFARETGLGAEPDPYLVVLVADGDKMGEAISKLTDPGRHRRFSHHLSTFATEAERIVRARHGVLVYSGGDDVLAFVPLDEALACARELYEAFARTMAEALKEIEVKKPTLSVGLAVAHFNEHLEDLLGYGRAAEKASKKPDRDGLAIHLHKRGGAPVMVRKQWEHRLDLSVVKYAGWFRDGAVSGRIPYELHRLADLYDDWPGAKVGASQEAKDTLKDAIQKDAVRVIEKKRPGGESQMPAIRKAIMTGERIDKADALREFARELLVARQFAVALRQSGSKEAKP